MMDGSIKQAHADSEASVTHASEEGKRRPKRRVPITEQEERKTIPNTLHNSLGFGGMRGKTQKKNACTQSSAQR